MTTTEVQSSGQAFLFFIGGIILIFTLFWLFALALSKIPGGHPPTHKKHKSTKPYNENNLIHGLYNLAKSM